MQRISITTERLTTRVKGLPAPARKTGTGQAPHRKSSLWWVLGLVLTLGCIEQVIAGDPNALTGVDPAAMARAAWLNRFELLACLGVLLGSLRRSATGGVLRLLKAPIIWVVPYQAIVTINLLKDGLTWEAARLSGSWLLLTAAMCASPRVSAPEFIGKVRAVFRLLALLAILVALVSPEVGLSADYMDGILPGATIRFTGIGGHPNGMGVIAAVSVLLELSSLYKTRRWLGWATIFGTISVVELIFTQSKTAIAGCTVAGCYLLTTEVGKRRSFLARSALGLSTLGAISWAAYTVFGSWLSDNAQSVGSLTGRTAVWRIYWDMAWQQPWFGYGPGLWVVLRNDATFQYKFAAGNAHNQPLNCFLMAGLVGVCLWVCYVVSLIRQGRWVDRRCRTIYNALLILLVIRCVTESSLEPGDVYVIGQMQMVLIGIILCRQRQLHVRPTLQRGRAAPAFDNQPECRPMSSWASKAAAKAPPALAD